MDLFGKLSYGLLSYLFDICFICKSAHNAGTRIYSSSSISLVLEALYQKYMFIFFFTFKQPIYILLLLILTGDCREETATPALFSHIYIYIYIYILYFLDVSTCE